MNNFEDKVRKGYELLTDEERRIVSFIPAGKDNSLTARELAPFTGLTQKELSRVSRHALDVGYPVIACQHGFYIATCDSEVEEYLRREKLRDREHAKTIESCVRFLQA